MRAIPGCGEQPARLLRAHGRERAHLSGKSVQLGVVVWTHGYLPTSDLRPKRAASCSQARATSRRAAPCDARSTAPASGPEPTEYLARISTRQPPRTGRTSALMVRSRPFSSSITIRVGGVSSSQTRIPRRWRPIAPTSTSYRAPTPLGGPPTWRNPRTAGSQSAWSRSAMAANASSGVTGSVTSERASIMPALSIDDRREIGDLLKAQTAIEGYRNRVVVVDIQRAQGDLVEQRFADAGETGAPHPVAALCRVGPHALDLHHVGRPRAELGFEYDRSVLCPNPAPAAIDQAGHAGPPAGRVYRQWVHPHLLPVHRSGGHHQSIDVAPPSAADGRRHLRPERLPVDDHQVLRVPHFTRRAAERVVKCQHRVAGADQH